MMNPILVGVGGTGQTVIASYLRLSQMAGFRPAQFYIVDSDTEGPLGQTLTRLRGQVESTIGSDTLPARWMIDPFPSKHVDRRTFGSLFGNLVGEQRRLFDCLFDPDAEATPIRTGMYGRPAIGATCIRHKILQEDVDLKEFRQALQGGAKHVILVGSCFGGTGSGGVPMLAQEMASLNDQPGYSLKVDAIIFLPWFRLVEPAGDMGESNRSLHDRLNDQFEPNAAAGIYYFREALRLHVESLVLLGVSDRGRISRTSSESAQPETPHVLNLLAALLVQNNFSGGVRPPTGISGYWHEEGGLSPSELKVFRNGSGDELTLLQVIHRAYVRQDWLRVLSTFLANFEKIPLGHQPLFIRAALEKASGKIGSLGQAAEEASEHLATLQKAADGHVQWIRSLSDETLFPLGPNIERPDSEEYDAYRADPMGTVKRWASETNPNREFESSDLKSPKAFADTFARSFLSFLSNKFRL